MADNYHDDEKKLPCPKESDPQELGGTFADTGYADQQAVGKSFADPNSLDDKRIGKNFEETHSSAKKHHKPVREAVHAPKNKRPLIIGLIVFAILFVAVLLIGGLPRLFRNRENDKLADQEKNAKPVVTGVKVEPANGQAGLSLPGTTIPLNEAFVYARASGYLKSYKVDIGDHVKKNQVLAVIEAPDLDAQVAQAREQLRQAQQQLEQQKSTLALATVTVQRYRVLVTKGVFSRQQGDQEEATYASALANVAAAERNVEAFRANLDRVIALQSYEYVRAPFDGVITQRNVDVGALISAGGSASSASSGPAPMGQTSSAGGSTQAAQSNNAGSSGGVNSSATTLQAPGQGGPLFGIAQNQRLRLLVSVPEGYAVFMRPGLHAPVSFQEYPAVNFDGVLTRTSDSVDLNTRTELVEVQLDNSAGKLVPGMYAVATFPPSPGQKAPLVVPGDAVAVRNDQSTVAVLNNGVVHMVPVVLGRDLGDLVEILSGVKEGDIIASVISDDVVNNAHVQVKLLPGQKAPESEPQATPPGGSTRYSTNALTDNNLQGQQQNNQQKAQGQGQGEQQKNATSQSKP